MRRAFVIGILLAAAAACNAFGASESTPTPPSPSDGGSGGADASSSDSTSPMVDAAGDEPGPPLPDLVPDGGKLVFVTDPLLPVKDFDTVGAADLKCTTLGRLFGRKGDFVAWLTVPAQHAIFRLGFMPDTRAWFLRDGTPVVTQNTVQTGTLTHAIDQRADGHPVTKPASAWTGTAASGGPSGPNCNDWGSSSVTGGTGDVAKKDGKWTDNGPQQCNVPLGIYCFEK